MATVLVFLDLKSLKALIVSHTPFYIFMLSHYSLDVDYEYVRWDIREDQEGVDFYVDVQLIDINTCEPVPNAFIDFWHGMFDFPRITWSWVFSDPLCSEHNWCLLRYYC